MKPDDLTVIEVNYDDGFAQRDIAAEPGDLIALALPCPAQRMGGGAGGQVMTSCGFCGEMMPSTAGPHSADGRYIKLVVVLESGGGFVSWMTFRP